jgi:hypothetical protein
VGVNTTATITNNIISIFGWAKLFALIIESEEIKINAR